MYDLNLAIVIAKRGQILEKRDCSHWISLDRNSDSIKLAIIEQLLFGVQLSNIRRTALDVLSCVYVCSYFSYRKMAFERKEYVN